MTFGIFVVFRTCADVVAGVVTKCLNARAKTKEGGIAVCLMYVEIEQQAVVQVWPLSILSVHPIDTCISRAFMPYPAQLSIHLSLFNSTSVQVKVNCLCINVV